MASSKAVLTDQAAAAWLGRHPYMLGSLGVVAVWSTVRYYYLGLGGLPFGAFLFFWLVVWAAARTVRIGLWWNQRRILLARHNEPAPGPRETFRAMWEERKRKRYVTKQWNAFCLANSVTGIGKTVPQLHKLKGTVSGDLTAFITPGSLSVKGAPGMTAVERIRSLAPNIAEVCACREVLVHNANVSDATVTFLWTQQFERVIPITELPTDNIPANRVPFAVDRTGKPVMIELPQSTLVAGMKGGGKSGITWSLLTGLIALRINTDLYASDPKNGIELHDLEDEVMERVPDRVLRVAAYTSTVDGTVELIEKFHAAMRARGEQTKNRQWTTRDADQFPLCLMVLDECVEVMAALLKSPANSRPRKAYELLKTIESQGRAIGFMVLYLTQLAQKNILEDIRDMVPNQISLRQKNRINTEMVLGDGAEAAGALCSRIGKTPGLGYMASETERGFTLFRATYCDDQDIKRVARSELPEGFGTAQGRGEVNRMCAVYRFFNRLGELLYVGITVDLAARWAQHATDKPWWGEVDMQRTFVTWHPSEAAARAVEEREIKSRFPRYNKQHNGANPIAARVAPQPTLPAAPAPAPKSASNVTPITRRAARDAIRKRKSA